MLKKTIAALLLTTTVASAGVLNDQGGYLDGETGNARYDRLADEVNTSTDLDRLKEIELILMSQVRSARIPAAFKNIAKQARTNRLIQECAVADGQRKIDITANARGGGRYAWITGARLSHVQEACLPIAVFNHGFDANEHDAPVYFDQSEGHTLDDVNPEWNIRLTLEDATWHTNSAGTPCSEFTTVTEVKSCIDPTGIRFVQEGTWSNDDELGHDGGSSTGVAFKGRAYENTNPAPTQAGTLDTQCLIDNEYISATDRLVSEAERLACLR